MSYVLEPQVEDFKNELQKAVFAMLTATTKVKVSAAEPLLHPLVCRAYRKALRDVRRGVKKGRLRETMTINIVVQK